MFTDAIKAGKPAVLLFIILTLLTGVIYPALITLIAECLFSDSANGRLIIENQRIRGSAWIGQSFTEPGYFWGRPSATPLYPYNAANSSGSNLALSNPVYHALLKNRINLLIASTIDNSQPIPIDLITSSGSGLDPDISPAAAYFQVGRVAAARKINPNDLNALIKQHTQNRTFYILGEPHINVLELNLALDNLD